MYVGNCIEQVSIGLRRTYRQRARYCCQVRNQERCSLDPVATSVVDEDHGKVLPKER